MMDWLKKLFPSTAQATIRPDFYPSKQNNLIRGSLPVQGTSPRFMQNMGRFSMSAYNPQAGQTDSTPWQGAWNNNLRDLSQRENIIADGSRRFKNGEQLSIGGKTYTVRDRMNERYAGKNYMDFFVPDPTEEGRNKAMNMGRAMQDVYKLR